MPINMYGVDIKVMPDGTPALIEINGIRSGTDFFKYPEGRQYYRDFANSLATLADGKPLFVQAASRHPGDTISRAHETALGIEQSRKNKDMDERTRRITGIAIAAAWKHDDSARFYVERERKEPEHEEAEYCLGAAAEGIEMYLYDSVRVIGSEARFELHNGGRIAIPIDGIGAIRARNPTSIEALQDVCMNATIDGDGPGFIEGTLNSKILTDHILRGGWRQKPETVAPNVVPTFTYGIGTRRFSEASAFLLRHKAALYALKPDDESCGIGVRIATAFDALREFAVTTKIDRDIVELYSEALRKGIDLKGMLGVAQPFIPSIGIRHPETGCEHDACARVIVLSDGDPAVVGAQWRVAPAPLRSQEPIERRLRANLSRGALAVPMDSVTYDLVADTAVAIIGAFERSVSTVVNNSPEPAVGKTVFNDYDTMFQRLFFCPTIREYGFRKHTGELTFFDEKIVDALIRTVRDC